MNMNQFTQKSLAALQRAQDIALEHGNQQIEQPHLLYALLTGVEMGLIDPERYLPVARKGIAALREKGSPCAADTLEEGFGVL